jgi:serine/threonine protein kinase
MLGTRVSHYDVIRPLGSGGMGVEAEDTRLGRRVALKFLLPALGRDLKALERFQREARAASALNHPNICTVYAIEQHDGSCSPPDCLSEHFIVMELLEGQTLAQMIDRHHRFDLTHLLDIAMQIADALESAHAKGIVHRDIKPAHIFLSPRGQVKILDFGIAQIEGARAHADSWGSEAETTGGQNLTVPGTAIGTVACMSPEQARGWLTDARTDMFSLGTVLYQTACPSPKRRRLEVLVADEDARGCFERLSQRGGSDGAPSGRYSVRRGQIVTGSRLVVGGECPPAHGRRPEAWPAWPTLLTASPSTFKNPERRSVGERTMPSRSTETYRLRLFSAPAVAPRKGRARVLASGWRRSLAGQAVRVVPGRFIQLPPKLPPRCNPSESAPSAMSVFAQ